MAFLTAPVTSSGKYITARGQRGSRLAGRERLGEAPRAREFTTFLCEATAPRRTQGGDAPHQVRDFLGYFPN